jgi:hypothetical protein
MYPSYLIRQFSSQDSGRSDKRLKYEEKCTHSPFDIFHFCAFIKFKSDSFPPAETPSVLEMKAKEKSLDADDSDEEDEDDSHSSESESEEDDSSEEEESDDEEELLRELEKIKKERLEEQQRQEMEKVSSQFRKTLSKRIY